MKNRFPNPGAWLKLVGVASAMLLAGCGSTGLALLNGVSGFGDYRLESGIAYGDHPRQRLDVYQPGGNFEGLRPTVVFYYGGCWGACTTYDRGRYLFLASSLAEAGYVVVVPDYRLYPEVKFDAIMDDASAAMRWVHTNIGDWSGDPGSLFSMGHSSGAQMALLLTLNEDYLPAPVYRGVQGAVGLSGPHDFRPFTADYMQDLFGPEERYPASQPVNFVDGSEPPVLLLHGREDEKVLPANSESLARYLREAGAPVELELYPELGHLGTLLGFSGLPFTESAVRERVLDFLRRHGDSET